MKNRPERRRPERLAAALTAWILLAASGALALPRQSRDELPDVRDRGPLAAVASLGERLVARLDAERLEQMVRRVSTRLPLLSALLELEAEREGGPRPLRPRLARRGPKPDASPEPCRRCSLRSRRR